MFEADVMLDGSPPLGVRSGRCQGVGLSSAGVRTQRPTKAELDALRAMAKNMGPGDGAVIYPEGTIANDARRTAALTSPTPTTRSKPGSTVPGSTSTKSAGARRDADTLADTRHGRVGTHP